MRPSCTAVTGAPTGPSRSAKRSVSECFLAALPTAKGAGAVARLVGTGTVSPEVAGPAEIAGPAGVVGHAERRAPGEVGGPAGVDGPVPGVALGAAEPLEELPAFK